MTIRLRLVALGLLGLSSCMGTQARHVPFDPTEHARYEADGDARVSGSALAWTTAGQQEPVVDHPVYCFPATSCWRETVYREYRGSDELDPIDARALAFRRETRTDAKGAFRFDGLPSGSWFVATFLATRVPAGSQMGEEPPSDDKGRWVVEQVELDPGKHVEVSLGP